jgi:hypothetical protein
LSSRCILLAVHDTLASVRWNREGGNGNKNKIEEPHIGREEVSMIINQMGRELRVNDVDL